MWKNFRLKSTLNDNLRQNNNERKENSSKIRLIINLHDKKFKLMINDRNQQQQNVFLLF